MCAVLLLLYRAQLSKAYEQGRAAAFAETRAASQVVADSWRSRVETAEVARAAAEARADATAANVIRETRTYYAQNPSDAAVQCLTPSRVQQARRARDAILSGTAGGGDASVQVADVAKPANS